jgi:hypothetical protein
MEYMKLYIECIQDYYRKNIESMNMTAVHCTITNEKIQYDVKLNWDAEWSQYVVGGPNISYQGINAVGIDIWPIEDWLEKNLNLQPSTSRYLPY